MSIPYHMRNLYINTFCSLLWNHLASYRILRYGTQPVVGDLVLTNSPVETLTISKLVWLATNNSYCVIMRTVRKDNIKYITEDEIQQNKYSIFDVVLPMIGKLSVVPENDVKQKYELNTIIHVLIWHLMFYFFISD